MGVKHRLLNIGPGGLKCPCCFPAPGSKLRAEEFRNAKKRVRRAVAKDVQQQLDEKERNDD